MYLINITGCFVSNRDQSSPGQPLMRQILLTILLLTASLSILAQKNGIPVALVYSSNLGGNPGEVTASTGSDILGAMNHQFRTIESPPQIKAAAVVTWKGSQDDRWSNPGNWEGDRVPGASDVARFAARSSSEVLVDAGLSDPQGLTCDAQGQ